MSLLLIQRVGGCGTQLVMAGPAAVLIPCSCAVAATPQGSPWSVAKQSMVSMFSQSASMSWRVPSAGRTAARPSPRRPRSSRHRKRWCGATSHVTGIPFCLAALMRRICGGSSEGGARTALHPVTGAHNPLTAPHRSPPPCGPHGRCAQGAGTAGPPSGQRPPSAVLHVPRLAGAVATAQSAMEGQSW